jgi:UDP-3-O-[3-hydroxymyristoyl] glucosamine N-acyltransferase
MTLVRGRSVKEVADFVQARVLGDETVRLSGISSVDSATPGDFIFLEN